MVTPRARATAEVDSPRLNRATAANRRASNFSVSRRSYPKWRGMLKPFPARRIFSFLEVAYGQSFRFLIPV